MNTFKTLLKWGLLGLVVIALIMAMFKREPADATRPQADATANATQEVPDGVIVTFFHGTARCVTCNKIEANARAAIEASFPTELQDSRMAWRTANYEDPAHQAQAEAYQVHSSAVVLVRMKNGQPVDWQNLDRVWSLVGNEAGFQDYVVAETRACLSR